MKRGASSHYQTEERARKLREERDAALAEQGQREIVIGGEIMLKPGVWAHWCAGKPVGNGVFIASGEAWRARAGCVYLRLCDVPKCPDLGGNE